VQKSSSLTEKTSVYTGRFGNKTYTIRWQHRSPIPFFTKLLSFLFWLL